MTSIPYRIVFMGTPEFALPSLHALNSDDRFDVVLTVSQPDRPQGRKRKIVPTPVHQYADTHAIPCYQPESAKTGAAYQTIAKYQPDFIVTAAYGQILPEDVLDIPNFRSVNVHASLLPRYRGASPVHWSIINGDAEAGVSIMEMVKAMDAGGIFKQAAVPITAHETSDELMDRLAELGGTMLPDCLID
ncbi:MAG TPA: methionyl-tRNA formyltransferase, partial [Clostridiaceae bacterium]|nr:methionyl-tRNA formyltransferase [Clostridiaceae bacterium]